MSLAGRVSCSMLNCFVSVQAFSDDSFNLGLWIMTFVCVCSKAPLTHEASLCSRTSRWGDGVVDVLADTRECCGYRCVTLGPRRRK